MTSRPIPYHVSAKTAAALLDMKPAEFLAHVEAGHLPQGYDIAPGQRRWNSEALRRIGTAEDAEEEFEP